MTTLRARLFDLSRNQSGATAVEFSLVVLPLMMLILMLVDFGTRYYAVSSIEQAVFSVQEVVKNPASRPATVAQVKQALCTAAKVISCEKAGFVVEVAPLTAQSPAAADPKQDSYDMAAGQPAIMRVVYPFDYLVPIQKLRVFGINIEDRKVRANVFFQVPG